MWVGLALGLGCVVRAAAVPCFVSCLRERLHQLVVVGEARSLLIVDVAVTFADPWLARAQLGLR